jgi:hypothetical protein
LNTFTTDVAAAAPSTEITTASSGKFVDLVNVDDPDPICQHG